MNPLSSLRRRQRRGSSLIEFALTLPLFILIVAVFIDYGWVFFQKSVMDNAVHEGCRRGAVVDPTRLDPHTEAEAGIRAVLSTTGKLCSQGCTVNLEDRGVSPAISLYCEVNQAYTPLFGIVPSPNRLESSTLLRYEWQDDIAEMIAGGSP